MINAAIEMPYSHVFINIAHVFCSINLIKYNFFFLRRASSTIGISSASRKYNKHKKLLLFCYFVINFLINIDIVILVFIVIFIVIVCCLYFKSLFFNNIVNL